jgi:hypothetical protein
MVLLQERVWPWIILGFFGRVDGRHWRTYISQSSTQSKEQAYARASMVPENELNHPVGIKIDSSGDVWVVDITSERRNGDYGDARGTPYCGLMRWLVRGAAGLTTVACLLTAVSCSRSAGSSAPTRVTRDIGTQVVRHDPVLLLPRITGGEGGWCLTLNPGVCPTANPVRRFHAPIVAEIWGGQSPPPVSTGFVVTTSEVAAVSIDGGRAIPTHAEVILPDHLRAVVVEFRGGRLRHVSGFNVEVPSVSLGSLRFTPLDLKGQTITQATEPRAPLAFYIPGRGWSRPGSVPRGVCGVEASHLAGLVASAGFVLTRIKPHTGLIGRPFVSCASNSYSFAGWPLVASVLLDAIRPGSTPASLPAMTPLAGHPGFFQAPVAEGEALARRITGAWLVVARGSGVAQRLLVLKHLRATVHM